MLSMGLHFMGVFARHVLNYLVISVPYLHFKAGKAESHKFQVTYPNKNVEVGDELRFAPQPGGASSAAPPPGWPSDHVYHAWRSKQAPLSLLFKCQGPA